MNTRRHINSSVPATLLGLAVLAFGPGTARAVLVERDLFAPGGKLLTVGTSSIGTLPFAISQLQT
jgi:hypothetical protein